MRCGRIGYGIKSQSILHGTKNIKNPKLKEVGKEHENAKMHCYKQRVLTLQRKLYNYEGPKQHEPSRNEAI